MNDTKEKMKRFIEEASDFTMQSFSELIGINVNSFLRWIDGYPSGIIEQKVRSFLQEDGPRLIEITKALKTAKQDRVALHQQRAAILQKARIHVPSKRRVPSPTINN